MNAPDVDVLPVDETAALSAAACLFRSLGDPSRLAILQHLAATGEHRVRELTEHLGLAQSTVSKHCRCLADCGLVRSRTEGRATVYSLAGPEVLALLSAAEGLLATTGDAVVLCPAYGEATR
ncbi:ArsR/SmtB family transcription factor [Blastococcus xanthinilyticus]|uniref:ArsR family transcriptional regulator n=1 Tax=Blastococcus xanthinilyticus TaxID=1564164 RepID=A0A5S5CTK9_9ACTN|nr:metalloregulator ArsR/SmtB family transcription factor [Blastococcus xanthinilyticus]TYP86176.1 ArsR family transcriptional regulator [Blastococcus xanthinilyticus]